MGLDLVEIVIAIEEHFDVEIPNQIAARLATPRDVIDYVSGILVGKRLGDRIPLDCPTQRAFYRVRGALCASFGAVRSDVSPKLKLDDVVPRRNRADRWNALQYQLGCDSRATRWPQLARRPFVEWMLVAPIGAAFTTMVVFAATSRAPIVGILAAVSTTILIILFTQKLTSALRTEFVPGIMTIGDLAKMVALPERLERNKPGYWTREHIAQDVRLIVMQELGLDSLSDDARFVQDLGAS